jgi:hypothetical protein
VDSIAEYEQLNPIEPDEPGKAEAWARFERWPAAEDVPSQEP